MLPTSTTADPPAVDAAVRVQGVRKTFGPDAAPVRALRGVDLHLDPGEFVALMGPSGSGKSTLLNIVAGLESSDDGHVVVAGHDISGADEDTAARLRRRHIGIVFQFFNLLDGMTALDNVALAALVGGAGRRAAQRRALDLLDLLGLLDKAGAAPSTLSGGERQRLAIARALANEPTFLLADEPTGALDSRGGAEVLELFVRLHQQGQTILLVTHSLDVASGADRIVELRDGVVTGSVHTGNGGAR
jgi:putative ABC transport system ATP-binding protein